MIEHVIVSESSAKASDPGLIVQSNVDFVNALLRNFLRREELCSEALKSYYVAHYSEYLNLGGFAEFVYRTGWEQATMSYLVAGLEAMSAHTHIGVLEKFAVKLTGIGAEGVKILYDNAHPGNQKVRQLLNEEMSEFLAANWSEDLPTLNGNWLWNHPRLVAMSQEAMSRQIRASSAAVPNRLQRIAESLAQEPRHMKLIRALCDHADMDFLTLVSELSTQQLDDGQIIEGGTTPIWHFRTLQGPFYMSESQGEAMMFDSVNHTQMANIRTDEATATL